MDQAVVKGVLMELKFKIPLSAIDVVRSAKGIVREISRKPERQKILVFSAIKILIMNSEFEPRIQEQLKALVDNDLVNPLFDVIHVRSLGCF
jgi:hypothetical protein